MIRPDLGSSGERPARARARTVRAALELQYEVSLTPGLFERGFAELVERIGSRTCLPITTPTVARLYGRTLEGALERAGLANPMLVLDCSEESKSWDRVEAIVTAAYESGLDRESVLIALGGGVCMDLVTLAASLIRRGIPTIRVPTTLVGQIDAGIGIKGAINFAGKKSALGCFHPPEAVLIDPFFLRTLPRRFLTSGFAEIIKMGLIRERALFELVEAEGRRLLDAGFQPVDEPALEILWRAVDAMLDELEPNLFENQTYLRQVDFGHTFSPSLEAAHQFRLPHGNAVAIDMAISSAVSMKLGYLGSAEFERVLALLVELGLPITSPKVGEMLLRRAMRDAAAHRGGAPNLVIPTEIGKARFVRRAEEIPPQTMRAVAESLAGRARASRPRRDLDESCLVFDIGGTKLRAALYEGERDRIGSPESVATPSFKMLPRASRAEIYRCLVEALGELGKRACGSVRPSSVAVGFPGPVERGGRVRAAPTVWGESFSQPLDLATELGRIWPSSPVFVMNDVTAAGYRYLRSASEDFCIVTISSGIGNKVFIEGRPRTGPGNRGGEIGHQRVDFSPDAPLCDCGGRGHLGAVASGRGALRLARRLAAERPESFLHSLPGRLAGGDPAKLTNVHLVQGVHASDGWSVELMTRVAEPLARVLAGVHHCLGIERFILIGGFARALAEPYRRELARLAELAGWHAGRDWDEMIELGCDDDHSGLLGAGRFAVRFATGGR